MLQQIKNIAIIALLFALAGCYDSHELPSQSDSITTPNTTIAQLRTLSSRNRAVVHTKDIIIKGTVTSDDSEGNFYRTLYIEDQTAAAEIFIGFYDLCAVYPPGCTIALKLNGCATYIDNETLQIGLPSESYSTYEIDYFYTSAVADRYIIRDSDVQTISGTQINASQLSASLCGRLVTLSSLQHTPLDAEDTATAAGYHRYSDGEGKYLYLNISEYADFADIKLPKQILSITGILSYSSVGYNVGKQFVITPRRADDITSN